MSEFQIKPATRSGIIPWIDLYSESGCGKTMSSLLLARGIVGTKGKIGLVDSESGRGSLYADVIPGGYDVLNLEAPFTPARYMAALEHVFKSSANVAVVDSMSHEWEGVGGVQDMATENETRSGRPGLHNWKLPKMEHQKLVQFLLRSPIPIICCIRAKYKTRQIKGTQELADCGAIRRDQIGKTVILKDDFTSPTQAEDFIYEATAHAEVLHDHSIRLTKCSHPDLRKCFPEKGPITVEHGKLIAAWCSAPQGPGTARAVTHDSKVELLKTLRDVTTDVHGWVKELGSSGWTIAKPKMESWIRDELGQDTLLDAMTTEQLQETIAAAKRRLAPLPGQAQLV